MAEAQTIEAPQHVPTPTEPRPGVTVVTQDNFNQWADSQLGITSPADNQDGVDGAQAQDTIEGAKGEPAKTAVAEPKEGDEEGSKVFFNGKWVDKRDFSYRLHKKTQEATAELSKKAQEAQKENGRHHARLSTSRGVVSVGVGSVRSFAPLAPSSESLRAPGRSVCSNEPTAEL